MLDSLKWDEIENSHLDRLYQKVRNYVNHAHFTFLYVDMCAPYILHMYIDNMQSANIAYVAHLYSFADLVKHLVFSNLVLYIFFLL